MNLRLPGVVAVVAVCAGAATLRGCFAPVRPAPLAVVTAAPAGGALSASLARSARERKPAPRAHIVVYVVGKVVRSGVFTLPAASRGVDALRAAGGVTPGADMIAVNLAKPLVDGEELYFPTLGSSQPLGATRARESRAAPRSQRPQRSAKRRRKRGAGRRSAARRGAGTHGNSPGAGSADGTADGTADEVVDLNAADEGLLETLPGIGAALAERIVLVREQSGPFGSLDDLLDVSGMTQGKLDAISPYVTLH